MKHIPVLSSAVFEILDPKKGETVIDVTLGLGGHARGFLEHIGRSGKLIGLDADAENLRELKSAEREMGGKNVSLIHANFRTISSLDLPPCDVLFADLGLSSPHLDDPACGFSFRSEGPLDCRFDRTQGETAAEILVGRDEEELTKIFQEYGEIRLSRKLAQAIKRTLKSTPMTKTSDLRAVTEEVFGWRARKFLPQVFQALRIAVNDEMNALSSLLLAGPKLLKAGGRIGVISYHSLEDRMVKQKFRALCESVKSPVSGAILFPAPYELLTKKAFKASLEEVEVNPRSRSACFRAIRKRI